MVTIFIDLRTKLKSLCCLASSKQHQREASFYLEKQSKSKRAIEFEPNFGYQSLLTLESSDQPGCRIQGKEEISWTSLMLEWRVPLLIWIQINHQLVNHNLWFRSCKFASMLPSVKQVLKMLLWFISLARRLTEQPNSLSYTRYPVRFPDSAYPFWVSFSSRSVRQSL